jgi:mRNA interferase YafQ
MTKYEIKPSNRFQNDLKLMQKRGLDLSLLNQVIKMLADGISLPESNRDHELSSNWSGYRECHIQPDWLLVYRIEDDILVLALSRTGSHNDLF